MRSSGLSLNRHLREKEKLAWHPYILQSLLARKTILRACTSVVHVRSKQNKSSEDDVGPQEAQDSQDIINRVHKRYFQIRILSFKVQILQKRIRLNQNNQTFQKYPQNLLRCENSSILVDSFPIFLQVKHCHKPNHRNQCYKI